YYTKSGASLLKDLLTDSVGVVSEGVTIHGLDEDRDKVIERALAKQVLEDSITDAVEESLDEFDAAIVDGIAEATKNRLAGEVFAGIFLKKIDEDKLAAALVPSDDDPEPNEGQAFNLLSAAISATFVTAAPTSDAPLFPAFSESAKAVSEEFRKK